MDHEPLLTTEITRIRKAQLKAILLKYNILTTNETTEAIRKKASILKQSLLLIRAEPQIQVFFEGLIKHTHVIDSEQKLQFPILAELEKIVLYDQTSPSSSENAYEPLNASDSESDNLSESGEPDPRDDTKLTAAPAELQIDPLQHHTNNTQTIPAMTENLPLISAGSFNGLNSENPTDFIEKYLLAAESNNWTEQSKLKLFPNHLGGIAINWFKNYKAKAPNNAIPNWETLKKDFLQAFTPLAQCSSLSAILENKIQGPNETTLSYLLDITTTCRRYDPEVTEAQIIHFILRGLRPEILQKVLTKENNTLDRLEKNLKEAEILEIKLKQNLALYAKQSNMLSNSSHNSGNDELSQLQRQVQVLTDLVATISPSRSQPNNWSPRPGQSRGYNPRYQQQTPRPTNQPRQLNAPQQVRFTIPPSPPTTQVRSILAPNKQTPKFCNYCKTNTHSIDFCWFRTNRTDHPLYNQPIVCRYCKQQGHVIQQCVKSRFYNPSYNAGVIQQTPGTSASNSENPQAGGSMNHEASRN